MQLELSESGEFDNPDSETISRELANLQAGEFAILRQDDWTFIQTLLDPDDGIVLEYQEGSLEEHYGTVDPPDSIDEVVAAFTSYLNGTDEWKSRFRWERMDLSPADYTVVVQVDRAELDRLEDPFACERYLELPEIGLDHLLELYALLTNATAESLELQFVVMAEIDSDEHDGVQLVVLPDDFVAALARLDPDAIGDLAGQWHDRYALAESEYETDDVAAAILNLSDLAASTLIARQAMVACAYQ